jgi:peroxiredoxin
LLGSVVEQQSIQAAPANDAFANRIALKRTTNFVVSSNVGATLEAGEPQLFGGVGGSSVWWSWSAPTSGTFVVSTDGSSFDTLVGVYRGSQLSNLLALAVDDDSGSNGASRAIFRVIAGESYQIAVDGFQGDSGQITLSLGPCGYPAPAWTLRTPGGASVSLADFRNNVILLDFFETICDACKEEAPHLERLHDELSARGFSVVGIAKDPNQTNVAENLAFLGITFPVAFYTPAVEAAYADNPSGVLPMPTKFLIDREGKIQMMIVGGNDFYFYYSLAMPLLTGATNLELKSQTQAGAMVLSWPANEFGWVVDAATNGLRLPWTQITGPTGPTNGENSVTWPASVVVTNDENTVTLPLSGSGSFFRLRKSQP